jgi:predicted dinucleotide-binding enzyme
MVGKALSARLAELGHDVMIGTRDAGKLAEWQASHNEVKVGSFGATAEHGEMVFNATNGSGSLAALEMAGEANMRGKVLADVSNPLDYSHGAPPSLFVANRDSLAEQIQRALPATRVVKTLNTVTASIMVYPQQVANGEHDVFVSGDDPAAKQQVIEILRSFGWIHILDLGDLSSARAAEMYLPLWLRLWGTLDTGMFNVRIMK